MRDYCSTLFKKRFWTVIEVCFPSYGVNPCFSNFGQLGVQSRHLMDRIKLKLKDLNPIDHRMRFASNLTSTVQLSGVSSRKITPSRFAIRKCVGDAFVPACVWRRQASSKSDSAQASASARPAPLPIDRRFFALDDQKHSQSLLGFTLCTPTLQIRPLRRSWS